MSGGGCWVAVFPAKKVIVVVVYFG